MRYLKNYNRKLKKLEEENNRLIKEKRSMAKAAFYVWILSIITFALSILWIIISNSR